MINDFEGQLYEHLPVRVAVVRFEIGLYAEYSRRRVEDPVTYNSHVLLTGVRTNTSYPVGSMSPPGEAGR